MEQRYIYTISAVYDNGLASNDATAETLEEAHEILKKFKEKDQFSRNCGGLKAGESVEYWVTKWLVDENDLLDGPADDENDYYELVVYR